MKYDPTKPGLSTGNIVRYGGTLYQVVQETPIGIMAVRDSTAGGYLKRAVELLPHEQVEAD